MTDSSSNRRHGGQPDNKNALKHGLYARHYSEAERRALKDMPPLESLSEIHMLRTQLDGLISLIETCEDEDRKVRLYNSLFTGSQRLLTAMRTHAVLIGDSQEILTDFWNALRLYQDEKGL